MTQGEIENLKVKIKASMVEHLTKSVGYPNCTSEQIMSQLKEMWIKLEEEKLILEGMNFQAFTSHAHNAFIFDHMQGVMGF